MTIQMIINNFSLLLLTFYIIFDHPEYKSIENSLLLSIEIINLIFFLYEAVQFSLEFRKYITNI